MTKQQIGAELKRLRTEAGLSQKQLADRVGESFQHISHIEAGKYNLTLDRLDRVGAALGVSVALVPVISLADNPEKSMLIAETTEEYWDRVSPVPLKKECLLPAEDWDI